VVDRLFSEPALAGMYDAFCAGRPDFEYYLPLVMQAERVLDVGCGTGALLHLAREAGHRGRLCGLDPAAGMLARARVRSDIEWIAGDLASPAWAAVADPRFDLVVMTGHAFQVLVDDADIRTALVAIRAALADDGRFVFETRNPAARAWEQWNPANVAEIVADDGTVVRMVNETDLPVGGDVVSFTTTFTGETWLQPELSRSTLRFLDAQRLAEALADAGLAIEAQFGDWARQPLTATSPEIITVARAA